MFLQLVGMIDALQKVSPRLSKCACENQVISVLKRDKSLGRSGEAGSLNSLFEEKIVEREEKRAIKTTNPTFSLSMHVCGSNALEY